MNGEDGVPAAVAIAVNMVAIALKKWKSFPDEAIPLACMIIGALAYMGWSGFSSRNLIIGLCAGGMAVGLNQAARQLSSDTK